jgi:ATP-dependent Lon protease
VLFACIANDPEAFSAPLLDRTKLLEVFGYIFEEKEVITLRYLGVEVGGGKWVEKGGRQTRGGAVEILNKHIEKVRSLRFCQDDIWRP